MKSASSSIRCDPQVKIDKATWVDPRLWRIQYRDITPKSLLRAARLRRLLGNKRDLYAAALRPAAFGALFDLLRDVETGEKE